MILLQYGNLLKSIGKLAQIWWALVFKIKLLEAKLFDNYDWYNHLNSTPCDLEASFVINF
ncbi:hypothetical protein HYE32_00885 [Mycoplasmopsis bovis]|nr:hypothetical protein [Mycoplasmopsis bovis]QQH22206.1 hypothetical protein HYE32_00885 [Mycoplasmopsis bovis]